MGFRLPGIVNSKKGLNKAATSKTLDIPKGYFAVYVGESRKNRHHPLNASLCKPKATPKTRLNNSASLCKPKATPKTRLNNIADVFHTVRVMKQTPLKAAVNHRQSPRNPNQPVLETGGAKTLTLEEGTFFCL
ncbi:hypothetical protein ACE6H2_026846 [Prunus campanulata]